MGTCSILLHHVDVGVILKCSIQLDDVFMRQPRVYSDLTLHLSSHNASASASYHTKQGGHFVLAGASSGQCMTVRVTEAVKSRKHK